MLPVAVIAHILVPNIPTRSLGLVGPQVCSSPHSSTLSIASLSGSKGLYFFLLIISVMRIYMASYRPFTDEIYSARPTPKEKKTE